MFAIHNLVLSLRTRRIGAVLLLLLLLVFIGRHLYFWRLIALSDHSILVCRQTEPARFCRIPASETKAMLRKLLSITTTREWTYTNMRPTMFLYLFDDRGECFCVFIPTNPCCRSSNGSQLALEICNEYATTMELLTSGSEKIPQPHSRLERTFK